MCPIHTFIQMLGNLMSRKARQTLTTMKLCLACIVLLCHHNWNENNEKSRFIGSNKLFYNDNTSGQNWSSCKFKLTIPLQVTNFLLRTHIWTTLSKLAKWRIQQKQQHWKRRVCCWLKVQLTFQTTRFILFC